MNCKGYLGHGIFRPGGTVPARIGDLVVSNIPRATGLGSHVVNIKRQNITLDAATILARIHGFVTPQTEVGLSGARDQYFGATSPDHAAHAVKRFTFNNKSIVDVYTRPGVDEVAIVGLQTMLGLVTDVHRRANLSIDKRLEGNPQRLKQLQLVVASSIGNLSEARQLARELEFERRYFESTLLKSMKGSFGGDADYDAMLSMYEATLSAPAPFDETPDRMVNMIADLVSSSGATGSPGGTGTSGSTGPAAPQS